MKILCLLLTKLLSSSYLIRYSIEVNGKNTMIMFKRRLYWSHYLNITVLVLVYNGKKGMNAWSEKNIEVQSWQPTRKSLAQALESKQVVIKRSMILIISISFFFLSLILICFYIVGWRQTSAWGELCEINRQLLCGLFSPSATELFCFLAAKRYSFESLSGSHYYWITFFC